MEKQKYSGIVVYTIHGGDKQNPLRDCLRQKITNAFTCHMIDESTYGISINAEKRTVVVERLKKLCKDAEKESNCQFLDDDFVNLYYPTRIEETDKDVWICKIGIQ